MANCKIKDLMAKRAQVYEKLQQWLRFVTDHHASCDYKMCVCICMSSQLIPLRCDLAQLEIELDKRQQKYDAALSISDVRVM